MEDRSAGGLQRQLPEPLAEASLRHRLPLEPGRRRDPPLDPGRGVRRLREPGKARPGGLGRSGLEGKQDAQHQNDEDQPQDSGPLRSLHFGLLSGRAAVHARDSFAWAAYRQAVPGARDTSDGSGTAASIQLLRADHFAASAVGPVVRGLRWGYKSEAFSVRELGCPMHFQSTPVRYGVAVLGAAMLTLVAGCFLLIWEAGAPAYLVICLVAALTLVVLFIRFIRLVSKKPGEVALRRSEIELNDFIENAALPIRWVGPGGIILRANRAELHLLGYREEEYVGRHISEFHVDPVAISELLRRLARGETIESYEARLRAKDGSIRHVLISSSVLFENGKFIHTRCITQDITARRQAEEALARAEQLFRSLAMKAPVGIFQTNSEGDCLFVNERWSEIAGLSPEEASGRGWIEALHPEDRERVFAEWYQAAQTGK